MPDDPHTSDSTPGPKPKLKADTPEVEALLIWLNNVKDSKGKLPVRALAERLRDYGGPGKTKWAEYLNGTALIPPHYLEMLVRDRVREPGKQEAMIAKGHRLLIKAEQSIAGPLPAKDRKLSQQELYRKLDEAQQTANVASQALWNMTRLTGGLYQLNTSLQQRCARLEAELAATRQQLASAEQQLHTAEHDKLAAEYARLGAEVEALRRRCADLQQQERASAQELEHSRQQLRTAEDNLKAAHRKLEEAEALRLAAVQRAERYRQALLLHSTTPVPHPALSADEAAEPTPEEYDAALEQSTVLLQEADQTFDELRRQLGDDAPPPQPPSSDGPRIVRGQLADNTDDDPAPEADDDDSVPETGDQAEATTPAQAPQQPPQPGKEQGGWGCAAVVLVPLGAVLAWELGGVVDAAVHHQAAVLRADQVVAGSVPSVREEPHPRSSSFYKSRAFTYRLASGQSISSRFALPRRMKRYWFSDDDKTYEFNGILDFVPDAQCPSRIRLRWSLDAHNDTLAPTHFINFNRVDVSPQGMTFTARLEAPAPCAATVRLHRPEVHNGPPPIPGVGVPIVDVDPKKKSWLDTRG